MSFETGDRGSSLSPTAPAPEISSRGTKLVPWQAIVKLRAGVKLDSPQLAGLSIRELASSGESLRLHVAHFDATSVMADAAGAKLDPIAETWALIDELRARPEVEYAHPNWSFQLSRAPNDPLYPQQWHYRSISLPQAWDLTVGSRAIRIAILDTGRNEHPDLGGKWVPGLEYDAVTEDGDARNSGSWRHGLHVASIAAGASHDGRGSAGACWNCQLLNVNVSDGVRPVLDQVARGIVWAVDNGANVINMSFESDPDVPLRCSDPSWTAMREAISYALNRKVTVVAAAGNHDNNAAFTVPASCPGVISVAATVRDDNVKEEPVDYQASYSNWGEVTLAAPGGTARADGELRGETAVAPGVAACHADAASAFHPFTTGVVGAWSTADLPSTSNAHCYRYLSGTSMAAPHVAGVVGLMLSRNPNLTPAQVRQILTSTARSIPCARGCGAGMLDALAAVRAAAPQGVDAAPVARFTSSCSSLSCTFNATSSTDDLGIVAYQWALPGGQVGTGATATFYMPGYASHPVRLTVTDTTGHSSEVTQQVAPPQPVITPAAGMYWNPQRSGNGLDLIDHGGGSWRAYWYTYEADGFPIWYRSGIAAKNGARWSAPLYRVSYNNGTTTQAQVGTLSLDFSSSTRAWLAWTLDGRSGGEPYDLLFASQGRAGVWSMPGAPGWSFQLKESGGTLLSTLTIFHQNKPRWLQGATAASSNANVPLDYISGPGLCPSCGGRTPATINPVWAASMAIQIADANATTGNASTAVSFMDNNGLTHRVWDRPLQAIVRNAP